MLPPTTIHRYYVTERDCGILDIGFHGEHDYDLADLCDECADRLVDGWHASDADYDSECSSCGASSRKEVLAEYLA